MAYCLMHAREFVFFDRSPPVDPKWGKIFLVDPDELPIIIGFDRKLSDSMGDIPADSIDFLSLFGGLFLPDNCRLNARQIRASLPASSGHHYVMERGGSFQT